MRYSIVFILIGLVAFAGCTKNLQHENIYDKEYIGTRTYTLEYSSTVCIDTGAFGNGNGIWEVDEKVVLQVYIKNTGSEPAMIQTGEIRLGGIGANLNGIFPRETLTDWAMNYGGYDEGVHFAISDIEGYEVNYLDPGVTDYIEIALQANEWLGTDIDIELKLYDWDGERHDVEWTYDTY